MNLIFFSFAPRRPPPRALRKAQGFAGQSLLWGFRPCLIQSSYFSVMYSILSVSHKSCLRILFLLPKPLWKILYIGDWITWSNFTYFSFFKIQLIGRRHTWYLNSWAATFLGAVERGKNWVITKVNSTWQIGVMPLLHILGENLSHVPGPHRGTAVQAEASVITETGLMESLRGLGQAWALLDSFPPYFCSGLCHFSPLVPPLMCNLRQHFFPFVSQALLCCIKKKKKFH